MEMEHKAIQWAKESQQRKREGKCEVNLTPIHKALNAHRTNKESLKRVQFVPPLTTMDFDLHWKQRAFTQNVSLNFYKIIHVVLSPCCKRGN